MLTSPGAPENWRRPRVGSRAHRVQTCKPATLTSFSVDPLGCAYDDNQPRQTSLFFASHTPDLNSLPSTSMARIISACWSSLRRMR